MPRRHSGRLWLVLALALAPTLSFAFPAGAAAVDRPSYVPGQLVVHYRAGTGESARAAVRARQGVRLARRLKVAGFELVTVGARKSVGRAAIGLKREGAVIGAQPNYLYQAAGACPVPLTSGLCIPKNPGDPKFGSQYALRNTGQTVAGKTGLADADIDATEAWNITIGSPDVTVAVVDTGIAFDQPDLAPQIWTNAGELGTDDGGRDKRSNGVDDDRNGYVDDWRGWDVVGRSISDTTDSDNDPSDLRGHGTHVAGIIGASGNNGFGVTGANWRVKLMSVRVQGSRSQNTMADIAEGFAYAADNGARIVNASLGGPERSDVLQAVIDAHPNVLFVVAAYNRSLNLDLPGNEMYPCEFTSPNLICVAATDNRDRLASFSNYSATSTDLGAPGATVISSQPAYSEVYRERFDDDPFSSLPPRWVRGEAPGSGNQWDLTTLQAQTNSSITDSPAGPYPSNSNTWIETASPIDLSGKLGCTLNQWMTWDTTPGQDGVYLQARTDPNFQAPDPAFDGDNPAAFGDMAAFFSGFSAPVGKRTDVSDFDGGPLYLREGLLSQDNAALHDGVYVDNLRVYCLSPTYSANGATEISFESGTSMATPYVAGVAALVLARYPDATVAEVRDRLLRSVDPKSTLAGKTVTGGRLNAYKALAESSVAVRDGVLDFTTGDGVRNKLTVARFIDASGTAKYRVTDAYATGTATQTGSRINPGAGCQRVKDAEVVCDAAGVTQVRADVGDLDDTVTLTGVPVDATLIGGPGADVLTGGLGHDTFVGGPGNDRILARELVVDASFECGEEGLSPGSDSDTVTADLTDPISASSSNCEVVSKG